MPSGTLTRALLWVVVLVSGPLVGAKLFDLVVLAGAWSAAPPASLTMLPYGPRWPVDTGLFFIPFSGAMLGASVAALASGWRTPWHYRWLLLVPATGIFAMLVLTVTQFWPMNNALWDYARGRAGAGITQTGIVTMIRLWLRLDWLRLGVATAGFIAAVRALSILCPATRAPVDPPIIRIALAVALAGIVGFVVWFVAQV